MTTIPAGTGARPSEILTQLGKKNLPLAQKVYKANRVSGSNPEAYSFIISGLEILYGQIFSEAELKKIITDNTGDECIDAIYLHPDGYIDVFDVKRTPSCKKTEVEEFVKSVELNVLDVPANYTIFNRVLRRALKKIHGKGSPVKRVRLFILRGGAVTQSDFLSGEKTRIEAYGSVESFKFLDGRGLVRERFASESYTDEWSLNILHTEEKYHYHTNTELIVRLSLKKIVDLLRDCESKGFDLFNKNVRSFLGSKSLSEGILETIRKNPKNFYKYHNGITIAAKKITQDSARNYRISSPQIINGAQTVNTIVSGGIGTAKLKEASILCKILVADDKLTEKICETSNTQVKVDLSDLRSNDDVQFELELFINSIPTVAYKYLRKKPFYTNKNTITLPEFTQWIYSAHFEEPAEAKNKKRKLFDATPGGLYEKVCIKNPKLSDPNLIKRLCAAGILVRQEISKEKNKKKKSILRSADLHIIAAIYSTGKTPTPALYKKVKAITLSYVKKEQKINPNITNNFIFTKSNAAWIYLKSKL